jgi:hypothetical protein
MIVTVKRGPVTPVYSAYGEEVGQQEDRRWLGLPLRVLAVDHPFIVVELLTPRDTARFVVGRDSDPREAKRHILDARVYEFTRCKPSYVAAIMGPRPKTPGRPKKGASIDEQSFLRP